MSSRALDWLGYSSGCAHREMIIDSLSHAFGTIFFWMRLAACNGHLFLDAGPTQRCECPIYFRFVKNYEARWPHQSYLCYTPLQNLNTIQKSFVHNNKIFNLIASFWQCVHCTGKSSKSSCISSFSSSTSMNCLKADPCRRQGS